jgi:hypothetical protein
MLILLGPRAASLQRQIAIISELWWTKNLPGKEDVAPNLIAFLLHSIMPLEGRGTVSPNFKLALEYQCRLFLGERRQLAMEAA